MANKSIVLTVRLTPAEVDALRLAAAAEERPMSSMARLVLVEWLRGPGRPLDAQRATKPRRTPTGA